MNYTVEKNEQYALIKLQETSFGGEVPADFETLARSLFREGYSNLIVDFSPLDDVDSGGVGVIRKINRQCTNELGLLVLVTDKDSTVDLLDSFKIQDLTILPTIEEAIDAVFMNDLENDFRNEEDDSYDGFEGSTTSEP
ncbi:STAS domain-containing protein [Tellurirhabdus bombi]|uniref:STAS domain-containing protein n=1 Tax=Tellurirhabdus bombi TaxID=2907205 RepID=UPI001F44582A|nr:STAS domain-containing protein [Tellurirhabdus bombi]